MPTGTSTTITTTATITTMERPRRASARCSRSASPAGCSRAPSALVVLLAAISLHRVAFGLLLILAFSAGLALSITGVGLIAVLAKRAFARVSFEGRVVSLLPSASALVILVAGLAMTARAVPGLG